MNKKMLLLGLLAASESRKIEGITRFQKLVFLLQKESRIEELYEFKPRSYGPFSKELYDDIDLLVNNGFISSDEEPTRRPNSNDKQVYRLTEKGKRAFDRGSEEGNSPSANEIKNKIEEYYQRDLWDLLEYVYSEYPDMAKNSELNI